MAVFEKMDGKVWAVNGVLFVTGLWKLLDGTSGFLMAKSREGSVADLDA